MRPRRYYQYVEKNSYEMSVIWKLSHILVFLLIAFNSLFAVSIFSRIYDIYNYRCILYAKPKFYYKMTTYVTLTTDTSTLKMITTPENEPEMGIPANESIPAIYNNSIPTNESIPTISNDPAIYNNPAIGNVSIPANESIPATGNDPAIYNYSAIDNDPAENDTRPKKLGMHERWSEIAYLIPGTENFYIFRDEIIFDNGTFVGKVSMKMGDSIFATDMICCAAIFFPLLSLVVASAFASLVFFFGRGGKKYPSDIVTATWLYVYPILIASVVMVILSSIASTTVNNGLAQFCSRFVEYTNMQHCSPFMDYFTKEQKGRSMKFWMLIEMCQWCFPTNVFLWILQTVLIVLRILLAADFHLYMTEIRSKPKDDIDEEEIIWEASSTKFSDSRMGMKRFRITPNPSFS
ncbi:hypothetical protein JTB14_013196 [Gonioctena quinquepunctata]|nr:hypothetical protein JTB14_013196 [Gonioctena quinquepunctata]